MTCFDRIRFPVMRKFVCRHRDLRLYTFAPLRSDLNRGYVDEL